VTTTDVAVDVLHPPMPEELQLEVTAACNLRCRMCLVRYRPPIDRIHGSLPLEEFRAIVDGNPSLGKLTLQGLGEPLLAPGFFEMIEYAIARGIEVGFNTNATLLDARRAQRLVELGVSWVHVSVDGATAETFEHVRDGAKFDKVVANLGRLVQTRRTAGADRPRLQLNTVVMRRNVAELPDLVRLAADIGVDRMWVQHLSHDFSDADVGGDYDAIRAFTDDEALWGSPLDAAAAVARQLGLDLRLPGTGDDRRPRADAPGCDWPWRSAFVTADARVQPCCMVMGADRAVLGDLHERDLPDIWHGDAYAEFRRRLLTPDDPPEVCRGCSLYRRVF
jgi:radical SAM protein with 4Fe4S-binding SPASM domain